MKKDVGSKCNKASHSCQGDRITWEGEKCEELKKENSVQDGVSGISNSLRGGASRKTATGREPDQSIAGKRMVHSGNTRDSPSHGDKSAKGPGERGKS